MARVSGVGLKEALAYRLRLGQQTAICIIFTCRARVVQTSLPMYLFGSGPPSPPNETDKLRPTLLFFGYTMLPNVARHILSPWPRCLPQAGSWYQASHPSGKSFTCRSYSLATESPSHSCHATFALVLPDATRLSRTGGPLQL
jgi:hypothetical protein